MGSSLAGPAPSLRAFPDSPHAVDVVTDGAGARAVAGAENESGSLKARLVRSGAAAPATGLARALDAQGREIGRAPFDFATKLAIDVRFDLPVELRNEAQRIVIEGDRSAGAAWLVDDRSRRRRVAIASGTSADSAQPLIAPSYYLKRALEPFADVSEWRDSASDPIVSLLAEKPSVLALADMSVAPGPRARRDRALSRRRRRAHPVRGRPPCRRRRRPHADRLAPGRPDAGRRAVLGDAEACRAVRERQPVLRPRRAGRSDGHAAGPGGARGGSGGENLGAPRRRHAAGDGRAARQGPHRPVPRDGRHHLVEFAAVGPVRRHAAPRGRRGRLSRRRGRAAGRSRSQRRSPALANAERLRRARGPAPAGRADRPTISPASATQPIRRVFTARRIRCAPSTRSRRAQLSRLRTTARSRCGSASSRLRPRSICAPGSCPLPSSA